jgi:hypothetical protein
MTNYGAPHQDIFLGHLLLIPFEGNIFYLCYILKTKDCVTSITNKDTLEIIVVHRLIVTYFCKGRKVKFTLEQAPWWH